MNNKIIARGLAVISLFLFLFIYSFALPQQAHAQIPCYTYTPSTAATVSVSLLTSSGASQTITIPNQNPPSILQTISFDAPNYLCAMFYNLQYPQLLFANFLTSAGVIPFKGSPFALNLPYSYTDGIGYNYGWFEYMDYEGLPDMGYSAATENAVISTIDTSHQFSINAGNGVGTGNGYGTSVGFSGNDIAIYPAYGPLTMTAPATNCVALSGAGPRKIVFLRGASSGMSVSDFVAQANKVITSGFKTIEPLKSNFDQFSFYLDLKNYTETSYPEVVTPTGGVFFTQAATQSLMNQNSCSGVTGAADQYFFYAGATSGFERGMSINKGHFSGFNISQSTDPLVAIHEMGHAYAGLQDEYAIPGSTYAPSGALAPAENCSTKPSKDFRDRPNNKWYGAPKIQGCGYLGSGPLPLIDSTYYRPSNSSLMNLVGSYGNDNHFNVISCGYMLAAIKHQDISTPAIAETNALSNWPTCLSMASAGTVVADGIPASASTPIASNFTPAGNGGTITGSGFTTTGNEIMLTPVTGTAQAPVTTQSANVFSVFDVFKNLFNKIIPEAHGQTTTTSYQIDDVPSIDGTSLNFTVPTSTPDGTYKISVAALNSPWTATSYTIVVSGNGAGNPGTGTGTGTSTGTGGTTTGAAYPASKPAAAVYSCTSGYTLQSNNTCFKPAVTTNTPASSYGASLGCQSGYSYNASMNVCQGTYNGLPINAAAQYTCPSGGTLSGSTCNVPASSVTTAANTVTATAKYSCSTGYTLATATCTINGPTNLTANSSKNGQVTLTWSNNSVPNGYNTCVERALGTTGTFSCLTALMPPSGSTILPTTYVDAGLPPYTKYQYRVRMALMSTLGTLTGSYSSPYSNTITATTAQIPTAPTVTATAQSTSGINLTWTSSENNISGYGVYLISGTVKTFIATTTVKNYAVSGLSAGTQYCYGVISSVNPINNSAMGKSVCATTVSTPVATTTPPVTPPATTTPPVITPPPATTTPPATTPPTATTIPATITYTCISGQTLNASNRCARTGSSFTTAPTAHYSCPTNYTLNTVTRTCTKNVTATVTTTVFPAVTAPAPTATEVTAPTVTATTTQVTPPILTTPSPTPTTTSVPATVAYTCSTGYTLTGTTCSKTTQNTTGTAASVTTTCPSGSTLRTSASGATSCVSTASHSITPPTNTYSCPAGATLNTTTHTCYSSTTTSIPATATYTCPSNYTLDTITNSCSAPLSMKTSTSTTTASVWDSITDWFSHLFK